MAKKKPKYDGSKIKVLKGLEAVRERPGMFLGDTHSGDALHHLIWEVIDNSVDEHLAGHCNELEIELYHLDDCPDVVCIKDNGRGIPVDMHPEEKRSSLEVIMTILHAGGKFDNESYAQSAGLHGVGVSAVNAVCEWMTVQVKRDGHFWKQTYSKGKPTSEVEKMHPWGGKTGTEIYFKWDPKIFTGVTSYSYERVFKRLQELAFLNAGLKITLTDKREKKTRGTVLEYEGGIRQYIEDATKKKTALHKEPLLIRDKGRKKSVEIALVWTRNQKDDLRAYTNNVRNIDGGTHLTGFRSALTRVFQAWAAEKGLLKGLEEGITGDDIRSGLTAIINLRIPNPSFSSQTKDKLVTSSARTYVEDMMKEMVLGWLENNSPEAKRIIEWIVIQARAREAAKRARDTVLRKDYMDPLSLPGKLSDCSSKDPTESEIFIVEGDSAGGSAKQGRSRRFQAILPLRGKVLNTEEASAHAILENKELGTLINALGCGLESAGNFDVKKLRYHRIIILTDADVDGQHIRTLLLTFFYRHMPRLIWDGYVYFGVPPLYRVKKGRTEQYFVTEARFEAWKAESPTNAKGATITRFKGLGEMNADALWHTTLDPESRTLCQVEITDAIAAERLFEILMGHSQVENRKEYIMANALNVGTLDI